jgi:hypothetical protein
LWVFNYGHRKVFESHLLTSFSNKNPLTLLAELVETEPMTGQQLTRNPENSKLVESKQPTSGKKLLRVENVPLGPGIKPA